MKIYFFRKGQIGKNPMEFAKFSEIGGSETRAKCIITSGGWTPLPVVTAAPTLILFLSSLSSIHICRKLFSRQRLIGSSEVENFHLVGARIHRSQSVKTRPFETIYR